jgi:5-(carboxyamino)imidazole ribonucleotide mutase
MDGGPLNGQDALLSTVQMPGGVPVACVAIGKAGAKNAAYLAAQIMAITDTDLAARLTQQREADAQAVRDKNQALQASLESTSN